MLKHLFGRSSSTSATVKKKDSKKGVRELSPSVTDKSKSIVAKKSGIEPFKGQCKDLLDQLDDKPVTAYGYEDSSLDDEALEVHNGAANKYENRYAKIEKRVPLNEFTDSPKGLDIKQAKSEVAHNQNLSMTNTIVFNKNAFQEMSNPHLNNTNNPRFNHSPSFVESSIAPNDASMSMVNDQKLVLNDLTKFNGEIMNEYIDNDGSRSRDNSIYKQESSKIAKSADGTPIKFHLDLSSILKKREDEQRGKQIYRVSRSQSKSPATTGHLPKQKAIQKLNQIKQQNNSGDQQQHVYEKFNLNNIAKNNIKDKKYSELREQIATGGQEKTKSKKDGAEKPNKRRTKEERTEKKNDGDFANQLIKKQTKTNYSININLSPKRNDLDNKSQSFVMASGQKSPSKDTSSPTRPSIIERSRIKPYQKEKNSEVNANKLDYSDPAQVKKAFNQVMAQTIEKNKKKDKVKKKVNIVDDGYNSPSSKLGSRQQDSAYRQSMKKSMKSFSNYNTPKKPSVNLTNGRSTNMSGIKQQSSGNYVIGQPGASYPHREKQKEDKERQQINQQEKKKSMNSNLYYGVMNKKDQSKPKQKKSAQKEQKERQRKAAQDRANRPWNLNQSYISQLSMSPQRRFLRKGTSVSKNRSSMMMSTFGGKKTTSKKYKPGQFGTKSQFGTMGRSIMGSSGNRYGFQNNLAGRLKRSSTISTFQPKFGRSTIAPRGKLSFGMDKEQEQDPNFRKSLEWRKQVAAKYNNFMRNSKSPASLSPTKKVKQINKSTSSPMIKRKTMSKRGDSSLSITGGNFNKDWSATNLNLSSKRKVSIKAKLQMLKDDDLLPDQDLYKFPTIGQISKMSPIGPLKDEPSSKTKKKKTRFDEAIKSHDFGKNETGDNFAHFHQMSQSSFKKEDIIIEEPKSSGGKDPKTRSVSSENPVIHSGKFESQRNENNDGISLVSAIKGSDQNHLNTLEQKPLSTMEFLESLKTTQYYNKTSQSRSFADVALEQKKKEDEDLFNNLMAGDGKLDSNRMALADNEEMKSKRTNSGVGSGLAYNSLNHQSIQDTSKFVDEPPHSPVFEGNNIFKESPVDNVEKTAHVSNAPSFDGNDTTSNAKQQKIEELKQKNRESRNRLQERRSRMGQNSNSPRANAKESKTNSVEFINFNPPEKQLGEDENIELKSEEPMAQVSINDISFSEQINDDQASSKQSDIDRFSSKRVDRNFMVQSQNSSSKGSLGKIQPMPLKRFSKPNNEPMISGSVTPNIYNSFNGNSTGLGFSTNKFNSLTPQHDNNDVKIKNYRLRN